MSSDDARILYVHSCSDCRWGFESDVCGDYSFGCDHSSMNGIRWGDRYGRDGRGKADIESFESKVLKNCPLGRASDVKKLELSRGTYIRALTIAAHDYMELALSISRCVDRGTGINALDDEADRIIHAQDLFDRWWNLGLDCLEQELCGEDERSDER